MASEERSAGTPGKGKNPVIKDGHLPVNEMLGEYQGACSPFGDDLVFPLPVENLNYSHPDPHAPTGH
jgi:succinate dehydrogenase / fumarate reductase iron-sulfur subunit